MEVNDKVFIYCYNLDDLPNKTPKFEEIEDLEGRSYFAIDKIKATNVKIFPFYKIPPIEWNLDNCWHVAT